jgi:GTP-binding protein HflX
MFDIRTKPNLVEKALLVGAYFDKREAFESEDCLKELEELVGTLSIGISEAVLVHVREMNARYLVGKGKAEELMAHAKSTGCDAIIFDNELSPAQQRAWEEESGMCVIDRQEVILDIFNLRARTREARLQVDLARMAYSIPRLKRMWAHLDRQGGSNGAGAGAARGEGETQLEVDRRLADKRIDKLKADLLEIRSQRETQRKERTRQDKPHVAIVGYTNVGKSSLLNRLAQSDVLAEDKLFATMDTSTRRMELPDGQEILLTDTVGFVRRLPHDLVQSFRATLEEAVLADFLVHVLDASHPSVDRFYQTTTEVLRELGAGDKRVVLAMNKIDLVSDPAVLHDLKARYPDAVFISVKSGLGIDQLIHRMHEQVMDRVVRLKLHIPMNRFDLVAMAHAEGKVLKEKYVEAGAQIECVIPKRLASRFAEFAK